MDIAHVIKDKFIGLFNLICGNIRSARGDPQTWEANIHRIEARERLTVACSGVTGSTRMRAYERWTALIKLVLPVDFPPSG